MPPSLPPAVRLDQAVVRSLKGSPLPGLSLVLVDRREPTPTFRQYGISHLDLQNLEKTQPVSLNTVFPIGASLSKNFLAVCITQLHAQGKLKLDDPITTYIPNLKILSSSSSSSKHTQQITLRHLLSHTSGIREWRHKGDLLHLAQDLLLPNRIKNLLNKPSQNTHTHTHAPTLTDYYCGPSSSPIQLVGTPGQQHIKSHHNYGLLALAAENVTGQDMRTLLTQQLFQPLGMHDTDLVPPPASTTTNTHTHNKKQLTSSFTWKKKRGFAPIPQGAGFNAAKGRPHAVGGSAYSTAEDMGKYIHAFLDPEGRSGGVLTTEMVDEMLRPVYQKDHFLPAQALSFAVEQSLSPPFPDQEVAYVTCGQGMSFAGYQSVCVFSRERGVGVGVCCNAGSDSYEMSQVAAEALQEISLRAIGTTPSNTQTHTPPTTSNTYTHTPPPNPLTTAFGQALHTPTDTLTHTHTPGFEAAVLWPEIVGVYQITYTQLSARAVWTLGGEVQVYVEDSHLRMRALWGPLRTRLFTKEKGLVLMPARDGHPLHYSVSNAARQVLATPVSGATDIVFNTHTKEMTIGLITLKQAPWWQSMRMWAMLFLAYNSLRLIGKGKFVEIMSSLLILG